MLFILSIAVSVVASGMAFRWAHNLMTRRLRYVDAAQTRFAPIVAGVIATVVMLPVTWLPIIGLVLGAGTAVAVGLGVGLGVASASRAIRVASYRIDG
jgi:purine-cytosine permease-like protein